MSNNDLISRAALLKHKYDCYDEDGHLLYAVPTGYIVNAPTVDAVPVVRCKDCRHSYFASNRVPSEQCLVCDKNGNDIEPDEFCADGERMDEGDANASD